MLKIHINKKQFKNLFKIFSLILLIDYPILPFAVSYMQGDFGCEGYDAITCFSAALFFIVLIAFFWCMFWLMNYIAFFMEDYRRKDTDSKWMLPFYLYVRYVQSAYKGKIAQEFVMKLILVILCCVVLYLFFRELYNLFFGL